MTKEFPLVDDGKAHRPEDSTNVYQAFLRDFAGVAGIPVGQFVKRIEEKGWILGITGPGLVDGAPKILLHNPRIEPV